MTTKQKPQAVLASIAYLCLTSCAQEPAPSYIYGKTANKYLDSDFENYLSDFPKEQSQVQVENPHTPSTCETQWKGDLRIGSAQDDEVSSVTVDDFNYIYITGYERGAFTREIISPIGDSSAFLKKYDRSGTLVWAKNIETRATDVGMYVTIGRNREIIYLLGRTQGALPGFLNKGLYDVFITSFDVWEGTQQSSMMFGDDRSQHPTELEFTAAEDLIIGGYDDTFVQGTAVISFPKPFVSKVSFGSNKVTTLYQADGMTFNYFTSLSNVSIDNQFFFSTMDSDGTILHKSSTNTGVIWSRPITESQFEPIRKLTFDAHGDPLALGSAASLVGGPSFSYVDVFVSKRELTNGDSAFTGSATAQSTVAATAGFIDRSSGDLYVTGRTRGSFSSSPVDMSTKIFVVQFDAHGNRKRYWEKALGMETYPLSVTVDGCGSTYLAGYTSDDVIAPSTANGLRDGFLLRIPPEEWRGF